MTTTTAQRGSYGQMAAPGLFVLLWSTGFIGGKFGLPYAEPLTFLLWRYGFVTLLLLMLALLMRAPWPASMAQTAHIAVSGVLVNGLYIGGVFSAIYHGVPTGIVSLIVGLQPLFTAVVAGRVLGEKVYPRQWVGFGLGLVGVLLVLMDKISFAGGSPVGVGMSVLALFGITAGTLYQKRFCAHLDLRSGGVIQFGASTLTMALLAPLCETMRVQWTGPFMFAMAWLVLVLSLGAISLLHVLIRRGEASRVASLFYLVPPVTSLLAFFCFGERLGLTALAGMFVTVTGVALAVRR
ncbi:DMT family transporter [Geobacter argillaceus]|uniref:Drug/metabolite transporter (DMT)-like permease n=1 Tax=Geobacter argillaceus TaxID=345631 RepID=A0A562WQY6_9BACT|nr:DMT family transporter [Geobacter argillaceus]TWJ32612.1 drug/metabolite transporter (DMT)-like permease [Geobacter argillaceus]